MVPHGGAPGAAAREAQVNPRPSGGAVSIMVLFGVGTLAMLGLFVVLFAVALAAGAGASPEEETADDDTIEESFSAHGVHFC